MLTLFLLWPRLYDNGFYDQNFKDEKLIVKLENCTLSILGGIQPRVAFRAFPQQAWEQGFCQRILWVSSKTTHENETRIFPKNVKSTGEFDELVNKLQLILDKPPEIHYEGYSITGFIDMEPTAKARVKLIEAYENIMIGLPDDYIFPREVKGYKERRFLFIWKLSMVFSAARYATISEITLEDVHNAIESLVELELEYDSIYANIKVEAADVYAKGKSLIWDAGSDGISSTSLMNKLCSKTEPAAALMIMKALQHMPELIHVEHNNEKRTFRYYIKSLYEKKVMYNEPKQLTNDSQFADDSQLVEQSSEPTEYNVDAVGSEYKAHSPTDEGANN